MTSKLENQTRLLRREIYKHTPKAFMMANISIGIVAITTETILNRVFRKYNLNHKSFLLLHVLLDHGGTMTIPELTRNLNVSRQAVALATRKLEKRGLISREESKNDRRRIEVTLTENGLEFVRQIALSQWRKRVHNSLMSFMSEGQAKQLTTILWSVAKDLRHMRLEEE